MKDQDQAREAAQAKIDEEIIKCEECFTPVKIKDTIKGKCKQCFASCTKCRI